MTDTRKRAADPSPTVDHVVDAHLACAIVEFDLLRVALETDAVSLARRFPELGDAVRAYQVAHAAKTGRGKPRAGATRGSRGEDLTGGAAEELEAAE